MEIPRNTNIKYKVLICNEIMLDTLVKLKGSGFNDEEIKVLLKCIGDAYCRSSISDASIETHIESLKEAIIDHK